MAYLAVVAVRPLEVRCEAPLIVCKLLSESHRQWNDQAMPTLKGNHLVLGERHNDALLVWRISYKTEVRDNATVQNEGSPGFEETQYIQ